MSKFYGMKTCTANLQEQLEDKYNDITHVNIAEMLAKDGYLNDTDTIQNQHVTDKCQYALTPETYYLNSPALNSQY